MCRVIIDPGAPNCHGIDFISVGAGCQGQNSTVPLVPVRPRRGVGNRLWEKGFVVFGTDFCEVPFLCRPFRANKVICLIYPRALPWVDKLRPFQGLTKAK